MATRLLKILRKNYNLNFFTETHWSCKKVYWMLKYSIEYKFELLQILGTRLFKIIRKNYNLYFFTETHWSCNIISEYLNIRFSTSSNYYKSWEPRLSKIIRNIEMLYLFTETRWSFMIVYQIAWIFDRYKFKTTTNIGNLLRLLLFKTLY